jgi:hypothetical protein
MEASGQPQDPATLPLGKEPSLHTEQVAGLASADLDVLEKRKNFFPLSCFETHTFQPVTILVTQTTPADVFFLLRKTKTTLKRGRRRVHTNSD